MIVPIILAAGEGKRLGAPKALIDLRGRSCLARVLGACRDGGVASAVVVGSPAIDARIRGIAASWGATVVVNPEPARGQSSSLRVGLRALPAGAGAFLIFPVDHPLVTGAEIAALAVDWRSGGAHVVAPVHEGRRGHPVLVDLALRAALLALPDDAPARNVINAASVAARTVNCAHPSVVRDMDTPEDLAHCLDVLRSRERDRT